jgi:peptide/nickel transport system ATP-binding protein
MMSDTPLLEVDDVEVEFGDSGLIRNLLGRGDDPVRAVDGVSFELEANDVLTLVGESGCGKTTLGKAAVGLQQPTDGTVRYRGQDIWGRNDSHGDLSQREIRHALQIIHQDPGSSLHPNKTVRTALATPLKQRHAHLDSGQREAATYDMLERIGLKPAGAYADRYPHQLSGGEKQRVALARALLMSPDVIFADEAVSALDVSLRVEMMDLMYELQDIVDTSFVFISHDMANARYFTKKIGGRISIMYLGEIVEIGPADTVINDPEHPYTRALQWATPALDPRKADSNSDNLPLRTIDIPDPSDPPSGCRFHTRCPEAREVCRHRHPPSLQSDDRKVSCFRSDDGHEYWDSPELDEVTADTGRVSHAPHSND